MSANQNTAITETLQKAVQLHQAGQLDKAERLYNTVLKKSPNNVDALNLKGVIAHTQGRYADALPLFERAAAALPTFAEAHFNKANSLKALERHEDALAAYTTAIDLKPDYIDARLNAGTLLQKMGRTDDAIAAFRDMARIAPADARGHYNLGVCLTETLLASLGDTFEAVADEAEAALKRAVTLSPQDAKAHFAYANMFSKRGQHDKAVNATRNAIKYNPNWPQAWSNLGGHLEATNDLPGAEAAYTRALKLDSDDTNARVNRSLVYLAAGKLDQGWDDYAHRFETSHSIFTKREWPWPKWNGEPLKGKKILVWGDQGVGDEILYASMIAEIIRMAGSCTVECTPRLVPLWQRSFPDAHIVAKDDDSTKALLSEHFDYQSSALDLGRHLRRGFTTFRNLPSFLRADPENATRLRQRYMQNTDTPTKLIGLSWRSANPFLGREKSIDIEDFSGLLKIPSVRGVNLQYGETDRDCERLKAKHGLEIICDENIDSMANLDAFAAQIAALDGVVTISNSTAHMAGALGVPTYLLVPADKKHLWYWFGAGTYCPWYRSLHVLRGQTASLLAQLENVLK